MIKRILVPIDGSASADAALSISASLAGIMKAELLGLFVEDVARICKIDPRSNTPTPASEMQRCEELIAEESSRILLEFRRCCAKSDVQGRFLSLRGKPEEVICQKAKTVDFVVIGNSGSHSGVEFKESGETLSALLRSVARPVLVVPEGVSGESSVAIAYDGSLSSDRALKAAAELAEISDIDKVHLLTVAGELHKPDTKLCEHIQAPAMDYLSAYDFDVVPVCLTGEAEEAITVYVNQVGASILALGAFGSHNRHETDFGHTTEALLKSADLALLLVA